MPFIKKFTPQHRFKKITDIPLDFFRGAELIVLDLDNTLVFSNTIISTPEIIAWVTSLAKQYRCTIFSNSFNFFKRAPKISKLFGIEIFLNKHKKPFQRLFYQMQQKHQFDPQKVFVVGDRIFTDVLFGNSNGAVTVLVGPLNTRENIFIKTSRIAENIILHKIYGK